MAGTTTTTGTVQSPVATINGLKTILQLAASSGDQLTIVEWGISFDNTNAALAPIKVALQRQTTAPTATAVTIVKVGPPGIPASASTVVANATVEGTASDILAVYNVNAAGSFVIQYPLGREPVMDVSTRLAIVTTGVTANISNAEAYIVWEE